MKSGISPSISWRWRQILVGRRRKPAALTSPIFSATGLTATCVRRGPSAFVERLSEAPETSPVVSLIQSGHAGRIAMIKGQAPTLPSDHGYQPACAGRNTTAVPIRVDRSPGETFVKLDSRPSRMWGISTSRGSGSRRPPRLPPILIDIAGNKQVREKRCVH